MIPVFFQYKFELSTFIDELIDEFVCKTRAWEFKLMPQGYAHKYSWPDIVLSDRYVVKESFDFMGSDQNEHDFPFILELLGCYIPEINENDPDGKVILFMPQIIKAAEAFVADYQSCDLKKCIEDLTLIVLIHEFTHWIVHTGSFRIGLDIHAPFLDYQYSDKDSIYFHESIAQIMTNYFCSKDADLWRMFSWLEKQQPIQYQVYKSILLGNGVKQLDSASNNLNSPTDRNFNLRIDRQFLEEHNVVDRVVFTLMLMRLYKGKGNSYNTLIEIYSKLISDSGNFQDKLIGNSFSSCLKVFNDDKWDYSTNSFDNYINRNRLAIAALKYAA
jgi:hypothetical protein